MTESNTAKLADIRQRSSNDLAARPAPPPVSAFSSAEAFVNGQRMATLLSSSALVPKEFQGNLPNCVIALEMAQRLGASPLAIMQSIYIVHGKPSFSSTFIIGCINASSRFSPLRFELTGQGDSRACVAWATDRAGERLESPPVSIQMAKDEGWYGRSGSKWKTMPELMLRYRCATLFGRLYAPDLLMGMRAAEEMGDTIDGQFETVAAPLTPDDLRNVDQESGEILADKPQSNGTPEPGCEQSPASDEGPAKPSAEKSAARPRMNLE